GFSVELGYVERAAGNAVLAADAIGLIEIDNAVGVLHNGAVRRAGDQATRLLAVHALVFAHQPLQAVVAFDLLKLNQVPEVPRRLRHGLVGFVKSGFLELVSIPPQACHLAGFAADTSGGVHQLAAIVVAGSAAVLRTVRLAILTASGRPATMTGDR